MANRFALGAPGVFRVPSTPVRGLGGVRMDVCAFAGIAPRGPARVPVRDELWPEDRPWTEAGRPVLRSVAVPVEGWDEYRRLYGGFEGPGLLPYAVAAFFAQGGRRAYVVRIVHEYGAAEPPPADPLETNGGGVAAGVVPGALTSGGGALRLRARDEGSWGNGLTASLGFSLQPLAFDAATTTAEEVAVPFGTELWPGTLLRLWLPGGVRLFRFVSAVREEWHPDTGERVVFGTLEATAGAVPLRTEVVEGTLSVDDGDGRAERHERLGLSSFHPRWMATALCTDSALVFPAPEWSNADLRPIDPELRRAAAPSAPQFAGGVDRWEKVVPADFFDPDWVPDDEERRNGVQAVVDATEVAMLAAPDLYSPGPLAPPQTFAGPVSLAGATFRPCVNLPAGGPTPQGTAPPGLDGLALDPEDPADLAKIVALQQALVDFAERQRTFVALLDVPPGLRHRQILAWRARFGSSYGAAYHPWLRMLGPDDRRPAPVLVNPSCVAAGIIARRERAFGVPFGPANELAAGVVDVAVKVTPGQHDELHPAAINVFLPERDGVRLMGARTLSRDPSFRQLSVRRLMTMLRLVLQRQTQWMVFEPNDRTLRETIRQSLLVYLRQLYVGNAFRGATEQEAFFVHCDEALNPPPVVDAGRLIAEVGVAPAEPLEFIVLRIARDGDGTLRVEG